MRLLISWALALGLLSSAGLAQEHVNVVSPFVTDGPAAYGLAKLTKAISDRGDSVTAVPTLQQTDCKYVIVAGLASDPVVGPLMKDAGVALPDQPEALSICRIQHGDRCTIVLCGGDGVGLMYAALDTADRIGWARGEEDLFAHVRNVSESPCMTDRAVSTYTMQRKLFEQRLYDPLYWEQYFDTLAMNRINSYVIIFGYENGGFMAPVYPYFFDVDEFPEVQLYGITPEQQAKNTTALRGVIQAAHQRGIHLTAGIWDHIYRGGVQGGGIAGASELVGKKTPHLVHGVSTENLAPYTKAALKKFLAVFPEIDGIQFRMHWESGLTREETPGFWHDVLSMLSQMKPDIRLDLRAKGLPDEVIEDAIAQQLPFRIGTKYWMEQLGLPFHPTHVNPQNQKDRRHGYADLLRYPQHYEVQWRIWSGGTARFLLWGDPEYVRRFVQTAQIYGGHSFEVNEMLATKMLGESHDAEPFELLTAPFRHYRYEFERYWHYYQVWGRVAYNPQMSSELWAREFARRFGPQAGPHLMEALHEASRVLPRIVAASYNYRYFPTTRGWAEMMRLGDLPTYAEGTGTDVEQFQGYQDAARHLLAGQPTAKRTPFQTSRWFADTAQQILADIDAANAATTNMPDPYAREFQATITDLKILAHLAQYHASRMKAAVWFNLYRETEDRFALDRCITFETQAIDQWQKIIESAGHVYPETLKFGVHRVGFSWHWKEELTKLNEGLDQLRELPSQASVAVDVRQRILQQETPPRVAPLAVRVSRAPLATPDQDLRITVAVEDASALRAIRLRYRHLTQFEDYKLANMTRDPTTGEYVATIPGSFVVPEWDLMYFVELFDRSGGGRLLPDMERETPYIIVPVKRLAQRQSPSL